MKKEFQKHDILVSQLLLTEDDFSNRIKYLNLSDVLNELLKLNVIPIINQNDAVSSSELETISDMVDISFRIMINYQHWLQVVWKRIY
ncbi:MAG: hypothetical protein L6V95_01125 [Candidatus Melainabacteria bacterium]|nr:MAG: hypothetical protein L6V95_01125 [Candidatus Melainabacteria bacterium]